jgi:predicted transcriptional regulator
MFTWIGATTPIPHSVWDLFGNLGARMYFMQIVKKNKSNQSYIVDLKQKNYRKKVDECNQATLRFLKGIWREERIEWESAGDADAIIEKIVQLSKLVTKLRGKINVVVKEEYGGQKTFYSEPIIEEPERCIQALYALMRGHALIQSRTQVDSADLPAVIDIALSSAPWDRVNAFAYLLTRDSVSTKDMMTDLNCSRTKAIRTMKTLELLELVNLEEEPFSTSGGEQNGYVMRLKTEFSWFKSAGFQRLWRLKLEYPSKQLCKETDRQPDIKVETLQSFQNATKV